MIFCDLWLIFNAVYTGPTVSPLVRVLEGRLSVLYTLCIFRQPAYVYLHELGWCLPNIMLHF